MFQSLIRRDSFETLKREFEPAICLDYIKAGVEAIIEDEVTSRFEAEELKVMFIVIPKNLTRKCSRFANDILRFFISELESINSNK